MFGSADNKTFNLSVTDGDKHFAVQVSANGVIRLVSSTADPTALPKAVTDAVMTAFPGAKITSAARMEQRAEAEAPFAALDKARVSYNIQFTPKDGAGGDAMIVAEDGTVLQKPETSNIPPALVNLVWKLMSVARPAAQVRNWQIGRWGDRLAVAAVNGPAAIVLCGAAGLRWLRWREHAAAGGVRTRWVPVDYACTAPRSRRSTRRYAPRGGGRPGPGAGFDGLGDDRWAARTGPGARGGLLGRESAGAGAVRRSSGCSSRRARGVRGGVAASGADGGDHRDCGGRRRRRCARSGSSVGTLRR